MKSLLSALEQGLFHTDFCKTFVECAENV